MFGREEKREEFLRGSRATGAAFATWWLSAVCAPCPAILLVAACAGAIRAEAAVASFEENPPAHVVIFASAEADALVAEALANNPELAAARQETSAARARVAAAGTLPDPMLSLAYVNDGASPSLGAQPMSRLDLGAQQAIPFPGKLGLQQRVAKADADRAATVPERVALGLEAAVRRTYAALLEARENLRLVGEQVETWSQIEEVVRARYSAGLGTQQDVLRAQSERTRLLQQRQRDEAAERSSLVEIRQLLFRPTDAPVPTGRRLVPGEVAVPAAGEVLSRAEEDTPEVKEAALAKERAQFAGELARRNLRPDFVASVGYANRGGLPLMWSAGVGISVPLWAAKKQRPLIAEAESQLESASATEVSLRRRARARTEERLIRIRQLEEESRLDAGALLIQDRLAVEAALASYRTGSVPFVTVLEALSTNFSDRRAAIARLADLLRADADLREFSLERTAAVASAVDARASSKGGM